MHIEESHGRFSFRGRKGLASNGRINGNRREEVPDQIVKVVPADVVACFAIDIPARPDDRRPFCEAANDGVGPSSPLTGSRIRPGQKAPRRASGSRTGPALAASITGMTESSGCSATRNMVSRVRSPQPTSTVWPHRRLGDDAQDVPGNESRRESKPPREAPREHGLDRACSLRFSQESGKARE